MFVDRQLRWKWGWIVSIFVCVFRIKDKTNKTNNVSRSFDAQQLKEESDDIQFDTFVFWLQQEK